MKLQPNNPLVADRFDFLLVYFASFVTAIAIVVGATIIQDPDLPLGDLLFLLCGGALAAVFPPIFAMFIPSGRRVVQIMFGAALLPLVGGVLVNVLAVIRVLFR